MKTVVIISTLFVIGSLVGYLIELFYRRFVSRKIWSNPGFLSGPYLPIYGMGVVVLFLVSNIRLGIPNQFLTIIMKIIIIGISMTVIEFIIGIITTKIMKIKLWDYSNQKGNVMGIICPLYSFIWIIIGCLYYFFINPFLVDAIAFISENLIYSYFIGLVIGMILVDLAYSIHLMTKLKSFKEYEHLKFDEFRAKFNKKHKKNDAL